MGPNCPLRLPVKKYSCLVSNSRHSDSIDLGKHPVLDNFKIYPGKPGTEPNLKTISINTLAFPLRQEAIKEFETEISHNDLNFKRK